jgi:hypothetical protein
MPTYDIDHVKSPGRASSIVGEVEALNGDGHEGLRKSYAAQQALSERAKKAAIAIDLAQSDREDGEIEEGIEEFSTEGAAAMHDTGSDIDLLTRIERIWEIPNLSEEQKAARVTQMTLAAQSQKQQGTSGRDKTHYAQNVTFTDKFSADGTQDISKFLKKFYKAMLTVHPDQQRLHFLKALGDTEREALTAAEKEYKASCGEERFNMDQIAEWMRKQYRLRFEKTTHMVQLNKNVRGNRKIAVWLHDLERVIQELETDHGVHTNMDDFMPAHISTCAEKDKYLKRILDNINQNLFFLEIGHMSKTAMVPQVRISGDQS